MTTIIEVQTRGLKVRMNNQVTLIAKHKDQEGEYFLNENLQKQYFKDTVFEKEEIEEKEEQKEEMKDYKFEVEYAHKGRIDGWALTTTRVKAASYEDAIEKVRRNFKTIYEISQL